MFYLVDGKKEDADLARLSYWLLGGIVASILHLEFRVRWEFKIISESQRRNNHDNE